MENKVKIECNKGYSHTNKPILMICLNKECEAKRLCCLTCIDELHRKHQLISLTKFQSMLAVLTEYKQPDIKKSVTSILNEYEQTLLQGLYKIVSDFRKEIDVCQKKIKQTFCAISNAINIDNENNRIIQELYNDFTNDRVCQYLDLVKEAENMSFKTPESSLSTIKSANSYFIKSVAECEKQYKKSIEELMKGIDKVKLQLSQGNFTKIHKISKINKSAFLAVNQTQDSVHRFEGAGGYPIALIEEKLTQSNDNVNVKVTEQPGNKGVWMGVCVLDIVKNFNFQSCYGIGKGAWAIDQVGQTHVSAYSWSHHDTNYNSQPKVGFQFSVGEIINIKVDFAKSVVIFTKGAQVYEQPIKTDLGDIYAFVGPTHLGDTIAVV